MTTRIVLGHLEDREQVSERVEGIIIAKGSGKRLCEALRSLILLRALRGSFYSFPIAPWSSAVIPILQMRKVRYITDRMTCPKSHMVNGRAEIVTQINEETGSERLANLRKSDS